MIVYMHPSYKDETNKDLRTVNSVDSAIEQLVLAQTEAIVLSEALPIEELKRLKAMITHLSPDTIMVGPHKNIEESLALIAHEAYQKRLAQYNFIDSNKIAS